MSTSSNTVVLRRDNWQIEIDSETWAELLLFLSKRGWQPSFPTHYLLAHDFSISQEDAGNLAATGQAALNEALHHPLSFYPVTIDMGKLAEIVCFCEEGAFRICR